MKEIGEKLKEARESIGIAIEEVSDDLKMTVSQIESVENGDMQAFKDIFSLKYFIRDYSKYLGLEFNDIVDEFNEYLFDFTSKISIKEIKAAQKGDEEQKDEDKISSPYTKSGRRKRIPLLIIWGLLLIGIGILVYFIFAQNNNETNIRTGRDVYEFTK